MKGLKYGNTKLSNVWNYKQVWLMLAAFASTCLYFKDTHREKAPSNKTRALTKYSDMGIWVIGTSNQLCIRGS